jgi:hypothetical protein
MSRATVNGKIAIGALVGALLMSSLLVGVSYGQDPGAVAEPTVVELVWHTNGPRSSVLFFLFDEGGGRCGVEDLVCGQLTEKDMPLYDVDGNEIGRQLISCTATDKTGWQCQLITKIQDGPHTDKGQVIAIGTKHPSDVHTLAVVGGTGAYEGVSGYARQVGQTNRVTYTLYLTPGA